MKKHKQGSTNLNTISKEQVKFLLTVLAVLFLSYFLSVLFYIFLPKEKISKVQVVSPSTLEYHNFDFKNAFAKKELPPAPVVQTFTKKTLPPQIVEVAPLPLPPQPEVIVEIKEEPPFVSTITIIAIFDTGKGRGFVTISERGSRETTILSAGETYKGAKLLKVFSKYALFVEKEVEYKIELGKGASYTPSQPKPLVVQPIDIKPIVESKPIDANIKQTENKIEVKRDFLETYTKNTDRIWRDISLKENLVDGKIDGFKVDKIKRDSTFEKLGLRAGDVIKSVNNTPLKSYDDAMRVYKKIGTMSALNMKIMRGNEIMELGYEIK